MGIMGECRYSIRIAMVLRIEQWRTSVETLISVVVICGRADILREPVGHSGLEASRIATFAGEGHLDMQSVEALTVQGLPCSRYGKDPPSPKVTR